MASKSVHLYYMPVSFYSQKVWLALEEKKVKFTSTVINIRKGAQNEPWYLRLNPEGQVPVLRVGDDHISGSEDIVDAVDKLNNAPVLVPDPSLPEGRLVKEWRTRLFNIDVEGITYGILLNLDLRVGQLKLPASFSQTKEEYEKGLEKTIAKLEALKEKCPDLREALDKKIEKLKKKPLKVERSATVSVLEGLEGILDDVEVQLRKSRNENIVEHWLCGPNFTVADVSLCVLLGRLDHLGLHQRYLIPEKRPALIEYWEQAKRRPSVAKVVLGCVQKMLWYLLKVNLMKVTAGAAAAGGVVALGAFLVQKYKS